MTGQDMPPGDSRQGDGNEGSGRTYYVSTNDAALVLLAGDGVSVIEWADKAFEVFPQPFLLVTLDFDGEKERLIRLEPRGERYERLVLQVQDELSRPGSSRRRK